MKKTITVLFALSALAGSAPAAETIAVGKMLDGPIRSAESEIVGLVQAMPADRYEFAPTQGEFKGVRTFALQARHLATVIYEVAAASNQEKPPVDVGKNENGPDSLRTKEQIVQYMKDAFAYAHKAFSTLTAETQVQTVKSPFGDGSVARGSLASIVAWHSFDHYGQMVVYARMNGVIPPASR
jgi:uncharacterized damage-inducible protein DinB